jgi:hypothetical protein
MTCSNTAAPLFAAAICHGTVPCLVPLMPFSFASNPSALYWLKTSLIKLSAVWRIVNVGVQTRVLWFLTPPSDAGLGLGGALLFAYGLLPPPGLTPSPEADGGKGEVAARVDPTAPIHSILTPMTTGPCSGSGIGWLTVLLVANVSPRLISRPEISAGANWLVEYELCRRCARMTAHVSSVTSIRRESGSAAGSVALGSAEGVAAGVRATP